MTMRWYHARAGLGRSGRVRVVHPGLFLGVVFLAAEVQARPQPQEPHFLELAGEVPEGLGDGRQGGSFSDHGFILDLGRIAGRGARDQHGAAERPAGRVVALELMFLDEGVLPENQRRRTHGGRHYTKSLAGMQTGVLGRHRRGDGCTIGATGREYGNTEQSRRGSMKSRVVVVSLAVLLSLWACATSSNRITEYLSGFQLPSDGTQSVALPLTAGLVVVLPEDELGKPTTPSRDMLQAVAERLQKDIQASPNLMIQKVFPSITIPANGLHGLSLERLQGLARAGNLTQMLVVVAVSRSASKLRFWPIMEHQLYVRMDAALVEVPPGRRLMT